MLVNDYVSHSNFNLGGHTYVSQMGTGGLSMQFLFDIRLAKRVFWTIPLWTSGVK